MTEPKTPEILRAELRQMRRTIQEYNSIRADDDEALDRKLRSFIGRCGERVKVLQPFRCDFGYNVEIGSDCYINFNCTILDEGKVTIGDRAFIGPGVSLLTACHGITAEERRQGVEWSEPVTIGADCWIGAGAMILPGVTIGEGSTIGADSVVTRSVPPREVWAGNPARLIKKL